MGHFLFFFLLLTASAILPRGLASPTSNELVTRASSDQQAFLVAHNTFRAKHGASPLVWDSSLASKADQWAARCKFEHSNGQLGYYGENLAAGYADVPAAVKAWTDEASSYNPSNPVYSHFTQVVWKSTKRLGCSVRMCSGIFASPAKFVVCEYSPPGNVIGEFKDNVQP